MATTIGMRAGARDRTGWPSHLWPMVFELRTNGFTVPRLNLGTETEIE
jgi:hypothetical protein